MIFIKLEFLNRETKENLDKARARFHRGETSEEEHDDIHNQVMDNFRIMTDAILSHKPTEEKQEWFGN